MKEAKAHSSKGKERDCTFSPTRARVLRALTHAPPAPSSFGCNSSHAQGRHSSYPCN